MQLVYKKKSVVSSTTKMNFLYYQFEVDKKAHFESWPLTRWGKTKKGSRLFKIGGRVFVLVVFLHLSSP